MAHSYSNSHTLGNGLEEIEFFSKDVDYDKELYESHLLEEDDQEKDGSRPLCSGISKNHKDLVNIWEQGGPIKILPLPDFDAYPLYFTNFRELDYYQLKELLGNFFTICEFENNKVRVTYKTEDDLRIVYRKLKKDQRYNLQIFLEVKNYYQKQNKNVKKNDLNPPKNRTGQRLIKKWINNGDVVVESYKNNSYPIQINNYNQLNHDELIELFSKYGKFTTIAQLENECVQVKFCTEEAARNCIIDFKKDRRYNVRLLFFLKELNTQKKLVKDVVSSKLDAHVTQLLNAEERIKFDPNQVPVRREPSRMNRKNKKEEEKKIRTTQIEDNVVYYKKNFENGNVYVKGVPLENPFLKPPHSYKVWKSKQNYLPVPPAEVSTSRNNDANYAYYLRNMKDLNYCSRSSYCDVPQ
ncbi:uncharacterized protein [Halyomorpha halys]|nr:uncharacterized protein LOC106690934 isoform X2 [Halyomorpha halys]XP_014292021.1 uncharacterized protein LOC106690934 isoform X2 [Halyomorpha halys]XP_014292022.1 uncharacterized protein LOC106690934 isoform X2 [Halyomorpha halys]